MPAVRFGCSSPAIKKGCSLSQFVLRLRDTLFEIDRRINVHLKLFR